MEHLEIKDMIEIITSYYDNHIDHFIDCQWMFAST